MSTEKSKKKPRADERRMSLGAHLLELRKRITISGLAIVLGAVGGFFLADKIWAELSVSIRALRDDQNASINYTGITEAFDTNVQIAFLFGVIAASPVWLYQIWAFVVPALVRKERRHLLGFAGSAIPLFFAGAVVAWLIFPRTVTLMLSFAPDEFSTLLTARYFLDFFIKLTLAVGVAFVLPVFLVLFNFVGVLSAASMLKGWRIAILLIVLFTALATPAADILAMFALAVPMIALFFAAVGIAWLHDRQITKRNIAFES